jgi:hypothetical protein
MTPKPLTTGFTEVKLRKWNIDRCGSKNAAIMASVRPKLCDKCLWVSRFTPIAEKVKYAMRISQKASMSRIKIAGFTSLL